ncbi:zinc finger BED domain-containing protein 4-like [Linepithema humile]|uniref:zinc finger BED domain-containing protein 4-like n=1 Tax=Linepithema humile TaxID=83485 RepID=UPI000623305E|nr:PREDICTED: zinc finger BED domain-containing protein 4-like [Linepithema humile]XP_012218600.1 PREDICTED: zinc finger BED domain-containing protein 4-like [Linepithema humile]XP_012218601.1 PREDICTED: zinc finger BED domain-containing protein 4-like [Linepithema humile]XP_012218602.1 PREDICTED: zinc finger BED domain-containing protein 4-like [Linepithema humile]XP_012218603.1 PREDICTED: zinc finger BED domain-containing protein 4-like [Linepithema humile]
MMEYGKTSVEDKIEAYKSINIDYDLIEIETETQSSKIFSDTAASSNIMDSSNYEQVDIDSASDCLENIEKTYQVAQTADCQKISDVIQSKISETEKGIIRSKRPSLVWKFFESVTRLTARCTLCNKVCKHCGNTSNMKQHLKRKHVVLWSASITKKKRDVDQTDSIKTKQKKIEKVFEQTNLFMNDGHKTDKITNAILYMIVTDKMALTTVENEGFQWLMKTIVPLYKVPSRRTITRLIKMRYETLKENFIIKIKKAICYSLICDDWAIITNQRYLGVTIHYLTEELKMKSGCIGVFPLHKNHTAEYLAYFLNTVIENFKLDHSKITAVITNNVANVQLAIEKTIGTHKHLFCFANILSLIVSDALINIPHVREIISKVKKIITIVRSSVVASDELKNLQLHDGKTEGTVLKFIQDVTTSSDSIFYMLNRFLELEQYVYPVISKCDNPPDMLKRNEIQILKDMVSLIKPIANVITEVSGESYATCSVIIPLVHCMKASIYYNKPNTKMGIEFKEKLQSAIKNRCENFENDKIKSCATILDPRFKKLHFENALAAKSAISRIELLLKENTTPNNPQNMIEKFNTDMINRESDVWDFHDHLVMKNTNLNEGLSELREYLDKPAIERKEDPFQYWKSMKHTFPKLYEQAVRYISILGTLVPSERIFSQAGDIKNDERSRLTGEHLNMVLYYLSSPAFQDWELE